MCGDQQPVQDRSPEIGPMSSFRVDPSYVDVDEPECSDA